MVLGSLQQPIHAGVNEVNSVVSSIVPFGAPSAHLRKAKSGSVALVVAGNAGVMTAMHDCFALLSARSTAAWFLTAEHKECAITLLKMYKAPMGLPRCYTSVLVSVRGIRIVECFEQQ